MDPQQGPSASDILIGQTVGNYLVTQKLGEGGMGSVYLAEHPSIGKKVALKVLHNEFSSNPEVAERFFTEAKSVNAIGHPNIVDIVDYGVIQAGPAGADRLVYFIMEFLAGPALADLIRSEAPLPPERALMIALQTADALSASHKTGIVHRDLKPDNIILIQRGRDRDFVKLLDFGIAKLTGGDSLGSHRTRTGLVLGTPAYMSPEQCEGRANVDHRTDVYALGICLYEMLVGRVPFQGDGYGEILVQHLTQQPIPPSQYRMMSPHVEVVVMKALEKRPDMRYPTMDEFIRAMSDPVGYVEAHGGVSQFLQRQLTPSTAPIQSLRLNTPMTPLPGLHSPLYGGPGGPTPTTLSAATGHGQYAAPGKNKTAFMILGVAVVAVAAGGIMFVLNKNSNNSGSSGSGDTVTMPAGSDTQATGSDMTVHGSNAVVPPKGSDAVQPKGSDTVQAKGSDTAKGSDAGSAVIPQPPTPKPFKITITSKPPGAEIFLNAFDTEKQTDTTIEVPPDQKVITITLRLKNYEDFVIKDLALNQPELTEPATLKKHHSSTTVVVPGKGSGTTTGSAGKGSGTQTQHSCDTCLERPE